MIDIHSHILPGLDDGAATLEEAVAMVRLAAAAGTTDIVASPHSSLRYAFDAETVKRKIAELNEASCNILHIYPGCDFHLTVENIEDALSNPERYTINHGCYLLIEFPDFSIPKATMEILDRLLGAGIVPVITHPERHPLLKKSLEQLRLWVESGCLVQVTAQSFSGRFGKSAAQAARTLMGEGLVHFVASDAHGISDRTPKLDKAWQYVAAHYGEALARTILIDNPRAALSGIRIETPAPRPRGMRWWWRRN